MLLSSMQLPHSLQLAHQMNHEDLRKMNLHPNNISSALFNLLLSGSLLPLQLNSPENISQTSTEKLSLLLQLASSTITETLPP